MMNTFGTLYIVATPIGHLDDLSPRAIETLKQVDLILAEDTRHSAKLMQAIGCNTPLKAYHAHNETAALDAVIDALYSGKNLALISDAGTPLISDPGFELVRKARQKDISVVPIPGACAFVTALSAAGIPCDKLLFMGFLPAKSNARREALAALQSTEYTVVVYESTHRIMDCLSDINDVFGQTYVFVLAKELTKHHEQFLQNDAKHMQQWLKEDASRVKGEFVLMFPPHPKAPSGSEDWHMLNILLQELPLKQAVKIAAQLSQTPKNELYALALKAKTKKDAL